MIAKATLNTLFGTKREHGHMTEQLNRLGRLFLEKGAVRGVTALKTMDAIREEFLLDSLGGASALPKSGRVVDIGTGGGVPGLVLAVVRPDLEFVLTDSASKKTAWVSLMVAELGLTNVQVVTMRLEMLGQDPEFRGQFDAVTAKAVAGLAVLSEFSLPLLKIGGRLLAYKGPALSEELREAQVALDILGGRVYRCEGYSIGEKCSCLCEVLKTTETPTKYPRRDGVPQKKPLI